MDAFQTHFGELSEILINKLKEKGVTQNVYVEHGPKVDKNLPEDFCYISYPQTTQDRGAYQVHDVQFELVKKDLKIGRADIIGVESMSNKLLAAFPIKEGRFTLSSAYIRQKGSDGFGHTSWTIRCECIVNTTDRYATDDAQSATT